MKCPTCKGKGKYNMGVTEIGVGRRKTRHVPMTCFLCEGKGTITKAEWARVQAAKALWCDCDNPSGDTTYYADGTHPNCSKHCWVCNDCRKITQVG